MADTYYRRYTELPALIQLLTHRQLTLLDPRSWDDRNDAYFLEQYREKRKLKSVLALCFTQAGETYHHWRVFAPGSAGVCISFRIPKLRAALRKTKGLKLKTVDYLTLDELRHMKRVPVARLPFLKRYAFQPEDEVRIVWESATQEQHALPVPIDLAAISRITLSPWLHPSLADEVKALLKSIPGCARLPVYRSTLISNAEWMKRGAEAR
ncbi:MAG: DUF2971 domain-containing protein [Solimonas sp.]